MNLHLVLTYRWFDEIESGKKRIEYREITPFWKKRIGDKRFKIKTVTFSRGYTSRTLTFKVLSIGKGSCPYKGWEGSFYKIHFKEIKGDPV